MDPDVVLIVTKISSLEPSPHRHSQAGGDALTNINKCTYALLIRSTLE